MTHEDAPARDAVHARPAARFTDDGDLDVRASAATSCRRSLWYAATGHPVTDPPTPETLTVLEAGNALEPVVLRAMARAGWGITPADPAAPRAVSVRLGPGLTATGHVDATGVMPLFGDEAVVEVKTRGPEAFKRWQTLGAERSHPGAVAQAAVYTLGLYGEPRDAVIAAMDTGAAPGTWRSSPRRASPGRWRGWRLGSGPSRTTTRPTGPTPPPCPSGTSRRAAGSAPPAPS